MKLIFPHILIILITLSNCGFKVIKQSTDANLNISKIVSEGDRRIGYQIKNKLAFYSQESSSNLSELNLEIIKEKKIKEKNIKNEITKYELQIKINIKHYKPLTGTVNTFSLIESQSYTVDKQHSQTLNNEKKVINLLTDKLFDQIILKLLETNDL
tara:strand:+ start:481 stop:948 length:468 start_codon:yes stop_codon:yes gene_type:complete